MNPNEPGILQYIMIYLLFQVGIGTWVRLMTKGTDEEISIRSYLIYLIPGIGVLYVIVWAISTALSKK